MTTHQERPSVDGSTQEFYGHWAGLYDLIARYTPGVPAMRRQVVAACRLQPGDTVVEMGCGTGANLPSLREAVGPTGTVIGIDFTGPVLARARTHMATFDNVHLVRADATAPPVRARSTLDAESGSEDDEIDAVLATFVVGMLADPAGAVDDWCDLVTAGGHVVLANAARTDGWSAPIVNRVFRAIVVASTPPTTKLRYAHDPTARLDARIEAAHDRLRARSSAVAEAQRLFGVVRLTGGRISNRSG